MDNAFWERMHGGSTHFPIALMMASLLFDLAGRLWPGEARRRELHAAGFFCLLLGALGSFAAVGSGLVMTNWDIGGTGLTARHHLFIWPAFALMIGLAVWRLVMRGESSGRPFRLYLGAMCLAVLLINLGAFWGGEMLMNGR